jgi:hypothetical protein
MKVLFKDEKQKSETIDILTQFLSDGNLKGDNQVGFMQLINSVGFYLGGRR